jgi:hypothetical protein
MVYNTQNYWVFGLCPSPGILDARKHNVSETHREDLYDVKYSSWVSMSFWSQMFRFYCKDGASGKH